MTREQEQYNRHDPSFRWTEVTEERTIGTVTYVRQYNIKWSDGRTPEAPGHFIALDGHPSVACGRCEGTAFTVDIGGYAVSATCVACGFEAVVYEG